MATPVLKSRRFREQHEADWIRLEKLVTRLEKKGPKSLTDAELVALPSLFRSAMSALSTARAILLDRALIDYLEALCARAYFQVYGVRDRPLAAIARFFSRDWPAAVRDLRLELAASVLIFFLASALSAWMILADPNWFYSFVPPELALGRDPTSTTAQLRDILYSNKANGGALSFFATFLFVHNTQVGLISYALGFLSGAPTLYLQVENGFNLGALGALYARKNLLPDIAGWLCVHGTTEIFALCIACASGFRLGRAIAFPGDRRRVDALIEAGRATGAAMLGVMMMLAIAGLLEGIARQTVQLLWARFAIGGFMLAFWLTYFFGPWTGRRRGA